MLTASGSAARQLSIVALLDRYAAGDFDAALAELPARKSFQPVLDQLKRDGSAWVDGGPEGSRDRREIAAATFALEAARLDAGHEWKWVQAQPAGFPVLSWKPAPLLVEWGCALLRRRETPRPIERWWQLGALAVGHRSEDFEFLAGNPGGRVANPQDEIEHLDHVIRRFPHEARFVLGGAIALEWRFPADALAAFEAVKDHPDVGAEATLRIGRLTLRQGRDISGAIETLELADAMTRDAYLVSLARYLAGQGYERLRRTDEAERAYRDAVAAVPRAQSATLALAALLFRTERRVEAHRLAADLLAGEAMPADPWREYVHGDDRFWPQIIARLRAEIRK
jgi:tetratricopeptide (TPR) repeat protein